MKTKLAFSTVLLFLVVIVTGCAATQNLTSKFINTDSSKDEPLALPEKKFISSLEPSERGDLLVITPQRVDTRKDILPIKSTQAYLQSIVDKLIEQWPHGKPDVKVFVSSKKDYSAMAGPDDSILVRFDLIQKSDSEDEITFILAHELAHILLNHAHRDSFQEDQRQAARIIAKLSRVTSMIEEIDIKDGLEVDVKEVEQTNARTYALYDNTVDIMRDLFNPVWARSQEDDADLLAIDLMVAAGYNPEATLDVFDRFESYHNKKEALITVFTDSLKGQAAELLKKASSKEIENAQGELEFGKLTSQAKKKLLERAKTEAKERLLSSTHRKPLTRKQALQEYYTREYPDASNREYRFDKLDKIRASKEMKQAASSIDALIKARTAFQTGDIDEANKEIKKALRGNMKSFADGLWLKYQISRATRDFESAVNILEKAQKGRNPGIDSYEALFTLYWKLDRIDDAMKLIQTAEKRYGDHDHFRPEKIFLEANSDLKFTSENNESNKTTLMQVKSCESLKKDYLHCVCKASGVTSDPEFRQKFSQILHVKREQEKQTQNRFFKTISDVFDMTSGACG